MLSLRTDLDGSLICSEFRGGTNWLGRLHQNSMHPGFIMCGSASLVRPSLTSYGTTCGLQEPCTHHNSNRNLRGWHVGERGAKDATRASCTPLLMRMA